MNDINYTEKLSLFDKKYFIYDLRSKDILSKIRLFFESVYNRQIKLPELKKQIKIKDQNLLCDLDIIENYKNEIKLLKEKNKNKEKLLNDTLNDLKNLKNNNILDHNDTKCDKNKTINKLKEEIRSIEYEKDDKIDKLYNDKLVLLEELAI